jgi:hypothetical protein
MLIWVKAPCGLLVEANVSEKRAVSFFRAELLAGTRRDYVFGVARGEV